MVVCGSCTLIIIMIVTTKEAKTIDAFSSQVIHTKMKVACCGEGTNIMTQALHVKDGSLPQGLTV